MAIQNFALKPIDEYLSEKYVIPNYQREYSWEEAEVEDFWNDLMELVDSDESEMYFLGQIVIHNCSKEKRKFIIDGQQRTCTSVILLCLLRAYFKQFEVIHNIRRAGYYATDIESKNIGRWDEEANELKLVLGEMDREYFMKNIQISTPDSKEKIAVKSHKRIRDAYFYFREKLDEKIESDISASEKFEILEKIYRTFVYKCKVMYIETTEINEAFIVFETLNARGKDLETADLLKNHIFRNSQKDLEYVKSKWFAMTATLDKIDPTKYIRHYWNSRSEFVREKDLYRKISKEIRQPRECKELIDNLCELAGVYYTLVNSGEDNYFSNTDLNSVLYDLKVLKASTFYPIVLAMYNSKYSETEILDVIKMIEILVFRNCTVCGKVANRYEILFAKIAYEIYGRTLGSVDEIVAEIQKEIVSDSEFTEMFKNMTTSNKGAIRFILRKLNNYLDNEMEIIDNNTKIHIEHIMPEKKGKWSISDEDHEEMLWRLGNLTLLGNEYNRTISNKVFNDKKDIYEKSSIKLTKELLGYEEWTRESIEKRQKHMAEYALKIWGIK